VGDPKLRPLRLSFGNVAETYHRTRPAYSKAVLDRAQDVLDLGPDAHVLDLAAGTGRLTHELVQRYARVVAVEPDDEMRALITDGEVLAGTAEDIPLAAASVDAVFVGDAFHWFDARLAVAEVARVLRARGGVAMIQNHFWETEPPLPEAALDLLREPYERSLPERREPWDLAFAGPPFEPLRTERFEEHVPAIEPPALLELFSTTSALAVLPDGERAALFAEVLPLLEGTYRLPIQIELAWSRLA
jgi:SAM-dependent methyltransferase